MLIQNLKKKVIITKTKLEIHKKRSNKHHFLFCVSEQLIQLAIRALEQCSENSQEDITYRTLYTRNFIEILEYQKWISMGGKHRLPNFSAH